MITQTKELHPNDQPETHARLLAVGSRQELIDWLGWCYPRGTWTDEKSARVGMQPITLDMVRFAVEKAIKERKE